MPQPRRIVESMTYEHRQGPARAVLFAIAGESTPTDANLDELAALVEAAGMEPTGRLIQKRYARHPETYLGSGKVSDLRSLVGTLHADVVVCDDELTPVQVRNLSDIVGAAVADRTSVILEIFACRARSRAGKLQVEMARLTYELPRLVGRGVMMSRLGGGIGTRGPGETRLELDRRRIRKRLDALRAQLSEVEANRALQRVERRARGYPLIALVGYTNAGKSSLLNALTSGGAIVGSEPFATVDPTSRELHLPDGRRAILTDTVGFVRNLPTSLIAAFRATLEEVSAADLLIEVYDLTSPHHADDEKTVRAVLAEIGASEIPRLVVYNKADQFDGLPPVGGIIVSARTRQGIDDLYDELAAMLPGGPAELELEIPHARGDLRSWAHRVGRVLEERDGPDAVWMRVLVSDRDADWVCRELGLADESEGEESEPLEPAAH